MGILRNPTVFLLQKFMSKDRTLGDITREYLSKHPHILTSTLARMLLKNHPEHYSSFDQARSNIRYYRNAAGDANRAKEKPEDFTREQKPIKEWMKHFMLQQEHEDIRDVIIPSGIRKTLLLSDIHIPYHDLDAITTALEYGESKGLDSIIINGDLIDFYKASRFTKDPTRRNLIYEIEMTQEFFDMLRGAFPNAQIYYKLGNHEERWELYLKSKAPEIFGDEYYDLETRLGLANWNIHFVKGKQVIKYGKLNIIHGHEFGQSFFSPVNPARGLFLRAKCPTIAGHNHQTSEHHENNLNGSSMATWSTGCLCHMRPEYAPFADTKWNHGAAFLEKDSQGNFHVDNFRIIDGKVV